MFRQIVQGSTKLVRRSAISSKATLRFSSTFNERERFEESNYFRRQEEMQRQQARAELEKILASSEHEQKKEVLEMLTKKEEKKTLWTKLRDWRLSAPLAILAGVPLLQNEILVLSAETQLVGVFVLTCSLAYLEGGGALAASFDERRDDLHAKLTEVDKNILKEVHEAVESNKNLLSVDKDIAQIHSLVDDLSIAQADAMNNAAEHHYREAVVKKLDSLVAVEEAASHAIRARMVNQVKANVLNVYRTDKAATATALAHAVAVLAAGNKPVGKDVVGDVFQSAFKSYRAEYSKVPADKDEILVQLQKDIAAIAVAPVVESKGGNVYEIKPVL